MIIKWWKLKINKIKTDTLKVKLRVILNSLCINAIIQIEKNQSNFKPKKIFNLN